MEKDELEKDQDGNVILKPVKEWMTAPVADIAVLLAIRYAETPRELETEGKLIQFVLMPQECLNLAASLTKQAKRILESPPPSGSFRN